MHRSYGDEAATQIIKYSQAPGGMQTSANKSAFFKIKDL